MTPPDAGVAFRRGGEKKKRRAKKYRRAGETAGDKPSIAVF
jgi:hypothetical protein